MRLLLLLLLAGTVSAQSYGPPLGELRLSFDDQSTVTRLDVEPMVTFHFYARVSIDFGSAQQNDIDGLLIWEASLNVPPQITLLSAQHVPNVAFCDGCSSVDWRALLGQCVFADQSPSLLMHYQARLLQDFDDLEITLGAASPSNFGGTTPGWRVCANTGNDAVDLHPFADGWERSIRVNSTVTTQASSWSTLKGRY